MKPKCPVVADLQHESCEIVLPPTLESEWGARPYFLWDTKMSWRDFEQCLGSENEVRRLWALGRLLREAEWADIWRLISPDDLARDLEQVNVTDKSFWRLVLEVAGEAA